MSEELNARLASIDAGISQIKRLADSSEAVAPCTPETGESLEAIVRRLDRDYQAQQRELAEFRVTTQASLERIDRVMDYLMRQSGGS